MIPQTVYTHKRSVHQSPERQNQRCSFLPPAKGDSSYLGAELSQTQRARPQLQEFSIGTNNFRKALGSKFGNAHDSPHRANIAQNKPILLMNRLGEDVDSNNINELLTREIASPNSTINQESVFSQKAKPDNFMSLTQAYNRDQQNPSYRFRTSSQGSPRPIRRTGRKIIAEQSLLISPPLPTSQNSFINSNEEAGQCEILRTTPPGQDSRYLKNAIKLKIQNWQRKGSTTVPRQRFACQQQFRPKIQELALDIEKQISESPTNQQSGMQTSILNSQGVFLSPKLNRHRVVSTSRPSVVRIRKEVDSTSTIGIRERQISPSQAFKRENQQPRAQDYGYSVQRVPNVHRNNWVFQRSNSIQNQGGPELFSQGSISELGSPKGFNNDHNSRYFADERRQNIETYLAEVMHQFDQDHRGKQVKYTSRMAPVFRQNTIQNLTINTHTPYSQNMKPRYQERTENKEEQTQPSSLRNETVFSAEQVTSSPLGKDSAGTGPASDIGTFARDFKPNTKQSEELLTKEIRQRVSKFYQGLDTSDLSANQLLVKLDEVLKQQSERKSTEQADSFEASQAQRLTLQSIAKSDDLLQTPLKQTESERYSVEEVTSLPQLPALLQLVYLSAQLTQLYLSRPQALLNSTSVSSRQYEIEIQDQDLLQNENNLSNLSDTLTRQDDNKSPCKLVSSKNSAADDFKSDSRHPKRIKFDNKISKSFIHQNSFSNEELQTEKTQSFLDLPAIDEKGTGLHDHAELLESELSQIFYYDPILPQDRERTDPQKEKVTSQMTLSEILGIEEFSDDPAATKVFFRCKPTDLEIEVQAAAIFRPDPTVIFPKKAKRQIEEGLVYAPLHFPRKKVALNEAIGVDRDRVKIVFLRNEIPKFSAPVYSTELIQEVNFDIVTPKGLPLVSKALETTLSALAQISFAESKHLTKQNLSNSSNRTGEADTQVSDKDFSQCMWFDTGQLSELGNRDLIHYQDLSNFICDERNIFSKWEQESQPFKDTAVMSENFQKFFKSQGIAQMDAEFLTLVKLSIAQSVQMYKNETQLHDLKKLKRQTTKRTYDEMFDNQELNFQQANTESAQIVSKIVSMKYFIHTSDTEKLKKVPKFDMQLLIKMLEHLDMLDCVPYPKNIMEDSDSMKRLADQYNQFNLEALKRPISKLRRRSHTLRLASGITKKLQFVGIDFYKIFQKYIARPRNIKLNITRKSFPAIDLPPLLLSLIRKKWSQHLYAQLISRKQFTKFEHCTSKINVDTRKFMNGFENYDNAMSWPTNRDCYLNSKDFPQERSRHQLIYYYIFASGFDTQILQKIYLEENEPIMLAQLQDLLVSAQQKFADSIRKHVGKNVELSDDESCVLNRQDAIRKLNENELQQKRINHQLLLTRTMFNKESISYQRIFIQPLSEQINSQLNYFQMLEHFSLQVSLTQDPYSYCIMELYRPVLDSEIQPTKMDYEDFKKPAGRRDVGVDKTIQFDTDTSFDNEEVDDLQKIHLQEMRKFAREDKYANLESKRPPFSNSEYYNKLLSKANNSRTRVHEIAKQMMPLARITEVANNFTYQDEVERNFGKKWRKTLRMRNYIQAIYKDLDGLETNEGGEQEQQKVELPSQDDAVSMMVNQDGMVCLTSCSNCELKDKEQFVSSSISHTTPPQLDPPPASDSVVEVAKLKIKLPELSHNQSKKHIQSERQLRKIKKQVTIEVHPSRGSVDCALEGESPIQHTTPQKEAKHHHLQAPESKQPGCSKSKDQLSNGESKSIQSSQNLQIQGYKSEDANNPSDSNATQNLESYLSEVAYEEDEETEEESVSLSLSQQKQQKREKDSSTSMNESFESLQDQNNLLEFLKQEFDTDNEELIEFVQNDNHIFQQLWSDDPTLKSKNEIGDERKMAQGMRDKFRQGTNTLIKLNDQQKQAMLSALREKMFQKRVRAQTAKKMTLAINRNRESYQLIRMIQHQPNLQFVCTTLAAFAGDLNKIMDENRNSLLIIAVKCGRDAVSKELLLRGCDVNHVNLQGNTSLHIAIDLGHKNCISLLIEYGASEQIENKLRMTPWQMGDQLT